MSKRNSAARRRRVESNEPLRVLVFPPRGASQTNPFADLLYSALGDTATLIAFSWRRALLGTFDVVHVQWPELIFGHRRRVVAQLKAGLFLVAMTLWRVRRVGVVETVHNEAPHEARGPVERLAFSLFRASPALRVYLSEAARNVAGDGDALVIPHGDYRSMRSIVVNADRVPDRLLLIGQMRPYKGVETAMRAMSKVHGLNLRVRGEAPDHEYGEFLARCAAESGNNVDFALGRLADEEIVREIRGASCVLVTYPSVNNSGIAILALSLGTPVIATDSESTRELRDEVGASWLQLVPPEVEWAASIPAAVDKLVSDPAELGRSPLVHRDWRRLARMYLEAYESAFERSAMWGAATPKNPVA